MKREDALLVQKIYGIEKEQGRGVYPADLASKQLLPKSKCQAKVEELRDAGFLTEEVERGANTYKVSAAGKFQASAYRDVKLEMERSAAV